jgi:23S rRNA (cytosine1962-C5)-methyltransferase
LSSVGDGIDHHFYHFVLVPFEKEKQLIRLLFVKTALICYHRPMEESKILTTGAEKGYELLDSGYGQKLERFGRTVLSRPDPQALWPKNLPEKEWGKADAVFDRSDDKGESGAKGRWKMKAGGQGKWPVDFAGLKFFIEPTPFKHVGLFPEQKSNWEWMKEKIKGTKGIEVLNLFGYTGAASLACASAGASVVHVDGSKVSIARARENAELSGLAEMPIRWILEDAREFVKRELRRGNKYDAIIMDPPSFGRGDKGQVWKIEEDLMPLFDDCVKLLSAKPLFFLINGYAAGYSAIAYANNLKALQEKFGGTVEAGELTIQEKGTDRLLPCGIFARWSRA